MGISLTCSRRWATPLSLKPASTQLVVLGAGKLFDQQQIEMCIGDPRKRGSLFAITYGKVQSRLD